MNRGYEYGVIHHLVQKTSPLKDVLTQELALTNEQIEFLKPFHAFYLNNLRLKQTDFLATAHEKDYLRVHTLPRRFSTAELQDRNRIIFENDDFLIFNKPNGVPCHATVDNYTENVIFYLKNLLQKDLYVTHRLDNPTQGLLLLAKNQKFQTRFNQLLKNGSVQKIYSAVVEKNPPWQPGTVLTHYMLPSPRAPKVVSKQPCENSLLCQLKILSHQDQQIKIELLTGRTHQIRAQLASEGYPILGDHLYGAQMRLEGEKIALTAVELQFLNFHFKLHPFA
jgi:23S rRNA pseudouridine1911/1915/1917 synthase